MTGKFLNRGKFIVWQRLIWFHLKFIWIQQMIFTVVVFLFSSSSILFTCCCHSCNVYRLVSTITNQQIAILQFCIRYSHAWFFVSYIPEKKVDLGRHKGMVVIFWRNVCFSDSYRVLNYTCTESDLFGYSFWQWNQVLWSRGWA